MGLPKLGLSNYAGSQEGPGIPIGPECLGIPFGLRFEGALNSQRASKRANEHNLHPNATTDVLYVQEVVTHFIY